MKLRLRHQSLRLRLSRGEVERLGVGERLEESVAFGPSPSATLRYSIRAGNLGATGTARFQDGEVAVELSIEVVRAWVAGNAEGIYWETETGVKVAVERDYRCLEPREGEDDSDAFEHPDGTTACRV